MSVGQAEGNGVEVTQALVSGLHVDWAGYHAVDIGTTLLDGVHVDSAGQDGLAVQSAVARWGVGGFGRR